MVDENEKDENHETPKSNSISENDVDQSVIDPSTIPSNIEEEEEQEDDEEYGEYDDYDEEEEEDEGDEEDEGKEDEDEDEDEDEEENVIDGVINSNEEKNKGKTIVEEETNTEKAVKDDKKGEELKKGDELGENSNKKGKKVRPRPNSRLRKKATIQKASERTAADEDKPESSTKKNGSKRVESMGMVFMCTSKTKTDCFRYKILGLPGNKKDQVAKIYKGMRLFLFDVDLRLMYGIFKAAAPGGYNLEPKAFKSDFPSQVRFTVLDDCIPVAEENFKEVLKENYYTRNKFEGLLKSDQVKKLCKLFVGKGRGGGRPKPALKPRRTEQLETRRIRPDETRRSSRTDNDSYRSREDRKKRKIRPRDREEERRPRHHSPPMREKRRYSEYERSPIAYDREPRYLPPLPPPVITSPIRSYAYERPPLDIHPYVLDRAPDHRGYRVLDLDRERDAYYVYSREAPPPASYREAVYTLPPEYHLVSREYHPPEPPEYRGLSGGSRVGVPSYRDVGLASDYRSSAASLPEYRSQRTHYRY